jgi:hypothetical protein
MALGRAGSSLWLTKGDLIVGGEPLHAMISGLAGGMKTARFASVFSILTGFQGTQIKLY